MDVLLVPGISEIICKYLDWDTAKSLFGHLDIPIPIKDPDRIVTYTIGFGKEVEKLREGIDMFGSICLWREYHPKILFLKSDFKEPEKWAIVLSKARSWWEYSEYDQFILLLSELNLTLTFLNEKISLADLEDYVKKEGNLVIKPKINDQLLKKLFPILAYVQNDNNTIIHMNELTKLTLEPPSESLIKP